MNQRRAAITSVWREAIGHFLPSPLSQRPQGRSSTPHFMAHRFTHPVVPVALLVSGLAAILLLTVTTEDIHEAPGFMVRSVPPGIFGPVFVRVLSCRDGLTTAPSCSVHTAKMFAHSTLFNLICFSTLFLQLHLLCLRSEV